MAKYTAKQKEVLTRLLAGEDLRWSKYQNGNPSYCFWGEWFPHCPNPIKTVRSLIDKKLVTIEHRGKYGNDDHVVLTGIGRPVAERLCP